MLRFSAFVALLSFSAVVQAADPKAVPDPAAKIEAALKQIIEEEYLEQLLVEAVPDIEMRRGIVIRIDLPAVEKAVGQTTDQIIVNCNTKGLQLQSALNVFLAPKNLTWTIHDEALLITSVEQEPKYVVTKVYPAADLGPDLKELQDAIEKSIDPPSWQTNGGSTGAIARYVPAKSLVVTHTYRTQRRVAELLQDLRAAKGEEKK